MARYYLPYSVLELNETAYSLGFEDSNSFGQAFRTWEGIPTDSGDSNHALPKDPE
jgi:AraC-like DNA-binding protein